MRYPVPLTERFDCEVQVGGQPLNRAMARALTTIEVEERLGSPAQLGLVFAVTPRSSLRGTALANGRLDPLVRVSVARRHRNKVVALFDGVITGHALDAGPSGRADSLSVRAADLTVLMDLDVVETSYPAMSAAARVSLILAKYAGFGVPDVRAPVLSVVPVPNDRIPTQAETDLSYVQRLARQVGHHFRVIPNRPVSTMYWGPELRTGRPQTTLVPGVRGVEELRFDFDGLAREAVTTRVIDPTTRAVIPIPTPTVETLKPSLVQRPAATLRHRSNVGTAKLDPAAAALDALAAEARSSDAVTGYGRRLLGKGDAVLRVGGLVNVDGVGRAHEGLYFVDGVRDLVEGDEWWEEAWFRRDGMNGP